MKNYFNFFALKISKTHLEDIGRMLYSILVKSIPRKERQSLEDGFALEWIGKYRQVLKGATNKQPLSMYVLEVKGRKGDGRFWKVLEYIFRIFQVRERKRGERMIESSVGENH